MSYLAILVAGVFFLIAAIISLFMFFKGYGKSYLLLTIAMLILVYFIFDLSGSAFNSLSLKIN